MAVGHEEELRADLQRHYGIDFDHAIAGGHSAVHIAALAAHMPHGDSVLYEAIDGDAGWTRSQILLALIANNLAGLIWGMSDPKRRGKSPTPIGPSWMTKGRTRALASRAMTVDKLVEALSKPRNDGR